MIRAASLGIDTDLLQYSQFLRSQGIRHRIIEESGQQVIWVGSELEKQFVSTSLPQFIEAIDTGRLPATAPANRASFSGKPLLNAILRAFIASPITLTLITLSLLVAAVSVLGSQAARVSFLFYPLIASDGVFALLGDITSLSVLLKTVTPMFLHFGELHLVFNMLWLWYFGKQLEWIQSPWIFLSLVLATSFISNTTQYLYIDYNNFGGMSGVVYGLVGYTWVVHTFMPRSSLLLNNNMFVFFVLALVIMEIVASSWIATAAHVGGLVSGLVLGVMAVLYYRVVRRQQSISRR